MSLQSKSPKGISDPPAFYRFAPRHRSAPSLNNDYLLLRQLLLLQNCDNYFFFKSATTSSSSTTTSSSSATASSSATTTSSSATPTSSSATTTSYFLRQLPSPNSNLRKLPPLSCHNYNHHSATVTSCDSYDCLRQSLTTYHALHLRARHLAAGSGV